MSYELVTLDNDKIALFERAFENTSNGLKIKQTEYELNDEQYSKNEKYIKFIIPESYANYARQICENNIPVYAAKDHNSEWSGFEFGGVYKRNKYYLDTNKLASLPVNERVKVVFNAYELLSERYSLIKQSPDVSSDLDLCVSSEENKKRVAEITDSSGTVSAKSKER